MTVRRVDFWQVKPGRLAEFVKQYEEFKSTLQQLETNGSNVTLVRVGTSGRGPAPVYWFGDWESMAAYGAFIDEAGAHEVAQEHWSNFFSVDSPVIHDGTVILRKLGDYGAPDPTAVGSVVLVRLIQGKAGFDSVAQELQEQLSPHYAKFGGNGTVWRSIVAGSGTGNVNVRLAFPDMVSLGGYLDEVMANPEIRQIIAPYMSDDPPARLVHAGIATVIAS